MRRKPVGCACDIDVASVVRGVGDRAWSTAVAANVAGRLDDRAVDHVDSGAAIVVVVVVEDVDVEDVVVAVGAVVVAVGVVVVGAGARVVGVRAGSTQSKTGSSSSAVCCSGSFLPFHTQTLSPGSIRSCV